MAIPKVDAFVQKVGKGPILNKVTIALEQYWDLQGANRTIEAQVECYSMLINACKKWIKRKDTKSDFKKDFWGQSTGIFNFKFTGRRTEISKIGETATRELMLLLQANGLITADQRGQLSFDINKLRQKSNDTIDRYQTKSLSNGYEQERAGWLSSNKTQAISGTLVHGIHTDGMLPLTARKVHKTKDQIKALDNILNGNSGTVKEWNILSQIEKIGDFRVAFLRKSERNRYMTHIQAGLLVDANDRPLDNNVQFLWTMDRYGNMFVYDSLDIQQQIGIRQVNHSSMNAGKEVICAGNIEVHNGVVTEITNTSGHYKPTDEHMANALAILLEEGLDLSPAEIRTAQFPGPTPKTAWWVSWRLDEFVQSKGKLGELLREEGPMP